MRLCTLHDYAKKSLTLRFQEKNQSLRKIISEEMEHKFKRTLVTTALPYANGPVHIGHLAGVYVPADIYTRFLRLRGEDTARICELADKVLAAWKSYTDEEAFIYAETEGIPHNAITPIARFANGKYEIDLVLRNNITTPEFPDGYYHPHPEYHHIKRENIGLIEVMGLAVLPARLKTELELLEKALLSGSDIAADERISSGRRLARCLPPFLSSAVCLSETKRAERSLFASLKALKQTDNRIMKNGSGLQKNLNKPVLPFSPKRQFCINQI